MYFIAVSVNALEPINYGAISVAVTVIRQRYQPTAQTGKWLAQVVTGWFAYRAVPGNVAALTAAGYNFSLPLKWLRTILWLMLGWHFSGHKAAVA